MDYIDLFRAIGIITMVIGHVGFGEVVDFFIHAWHMPMFFLISGFFYKDKDITFWNFLKSKSKSLLLPYFVFGILNALFCLIYNDTEWIEHKDIVVILKEIFWDNTTILPAGAIWFLTALFMTNLIYFILTKLIKNIYILTIVVLAIAIFGNIAIYVLPIRLPWAMDAGCVGVGLYHIGRGMKVLSRKYSILSLKIFIWLPITACAMVGILLNGYINMRLDEYAIIPLFWFNAIIDTLILLNLAHYLHDFFEKIHLSMVNKYFDRIGKNSIVYVCCNQFVIFYVALFFSIFDTPLIVERSLTLLVSLAILCGVEHIVESTKLRILFGK